jgi:hypothetical protein
MLAPRPLMRVARAAAKVRRLRASTRTTWMRDRSPTRAGDPANLNEDYATFRSLVPKEHTFAAWPMPDTSQYAKVKPSYTVGERVVTDNVTKLRWQRVLPEIYPDCQGNYDFVGKLRGVGSGCTWEEAFAYCARPELAEELGGGMWRLPTKIELESLINVHRVNAIDYSLDSFPIDSVWTSSPYPNTIVDGLKMSWSVDFMIGVSGPRGRTKGSRVRCVSGPSSTGGNAQSLELVDNVARDLVTGIAWQRFPDSATRNWRDAREYCKTLTLDGGGWHLPSLKELLTIVDATRHQPAHDMRALGYVPNAAYWSSSIYLDQRNSAFFVHFEQGVSSVSDNLDERYYVRCSR